MDESSQKKTIVFIDYSNYHYGLRKLGWKIDFLKFKQWLESNYDIAKIYYYEGIHSTKSFQDLKRRDLENLSPSVIESMFNEYKEKKNRYFRKLRSFGYSVYTKPINSVYDEPRGEYVLKCNFDVELTMQALFDIDNYQQIILCSGDGDFTRLVKYLKYEGKRVIVMVVAGRFSRLLKKHSNKVVTINQYRDKIEYKAENAT